jgi:hypothetical protein
MTFRASVGVAVTTLTMFFLAWFTPTIDKRPTRDLIDAINNGMTRTVVYSMLGPPSRVRDNGPDEGHFEEWVFPEYYVIISYDKNDNVTGKSAGMLHNPTLSERLLRYVKR